MPIVTRFFVWLGWSSSSHVARWRAGRRSPHDSGTMFVDSHAHLEGERFDADRDQVLARAREAGLRNIVAIGSGTGPGSLDCAILLAEKYDQLYATIGIHPHEAQLAKDSDFAELEQLASAPR